MTFSPSSLLGILSVVVLISCSNEHGRTVDTQSSVEASEVKAVDETSDKKSAVKPGTITSIKLENLFGLQQSGQVLLVDCRQPLFHRMGHIEGSINLPVKKYQSTYPSIKGQFDAAVAGNQIIVLYCQNEKCPYANTVAKKLAQEGYSVTIYAGGWEQWKQAGFE